MKAATKNTDGARVSPPLRSYDVAIAAARRRSPIVIDAARGLRAYDRALSARLATEGGGR